MFNPFSSTKRMIGTGAIAFAGWWTFLAPLPPTSPSNTEPTTETDTPETDATHSGSFDHRNELLQSANSFRQWARQTLAHYTGDHTSPANGETNAFRPQVRIGTIHINELNQTKFRKEKVINLLREFGRQCDVLAIQGLEANQQEVLIEWVAELTQPNMHYDYLLGPIVGRGTEQRQFAFIYNKYKLETDRNQTYTLQDPQDLLMFDPLVAWFRVRGIDPAKAFTFTLVNMELTDPTFAQEQNLLHEIVQSIRNDGRREDDIILAGTFECAAEQIRLCQDGWFGVLGNAPTDPSFQKRRDNILINTRTTEEFQGKGEVFDFLRAYNLTVQDALQISQHLPAWGEFSALEGGFQ
jgi:hypothetical protein